MFYFTTLFLVPLLLRCIQAKDNAALQYGITDLSVLGVLGYQGWVSGQDGSIYTGWGGRSIEVSVYRSEAAVPIAQQTPSGLPFHPHPCSFSLYFPLCLIIFFHYLSLFHLLFSCFCSTCMLKPFFCKKITSPHLLFVPYLILSFQKNIWTGSRTPKTSYAHRNQRLGQLIYYHREATVAQIVKS